MEEVTGLKERQVKNDIASKTNGDQASCKSSGCQQRSLTAAMLQTLTVLWPPLLPVITATTVISRPGFPWGLGLIEFSRNWPRDESPREFGTMCCPVCALGHKLFMIFETLRGSS